MTGTNAFFFDALTLTGFARAAYYLGFPNASLLYFALPLALALLALALPADGGAACRSSSRSSRSASWLAAGAAVYATDSLATAGTRAHIRARRRRTGSTAQASARRATSPSRESNDFLGTQVETWNRNFRGIVVLGKPAPDPCPVEVARVRSDGTLVIAGGRRGPRCSSSTSAAQPSISKDGGRAAHATASSPTAFPPAHTSTRSPAAWHPTAGPANSSTTASGRSEAGRYELTLSLPAGQPAAEGESLSAARSAQVIRPRGHELRLSIPTDRAPTARSSASTCPAHSSADEFSGAAGLRAALRDGQAHVRRATPKRLKRPRPHRAAHRPCRCAPT